MKTLSRRTLLASGIGFSAVALARWEATPDTVLYNGAVLTMSPGTPEVEALAVSGNRILALGSSAEMLALAKPGTRRIDLGKKRVTPGFNDAHAHPGLGGVQLLTEVALEMDSIDAIKTALRAKAATTPPGQWVVGFLYDDGKTNRPIDRSDLDAVAPDHPLLVRHRGGHTVFVNSQALALAHVDERTPNPAHGEYFRDAAGRLNGRAAEDASAVLTALIQREPTRDEYRKGAAQISKHLASRGITSVCDAMGSPSLLQGYQDARDADELRVRFYSHIDASYIDKLIAAGVHTGLGDEWVRIGAVKLFSDGSISERTALLSEPYIGLGEFRGIARATRESLYADARKAYLAGWQVGTHANGDVAIDMVLGIYEQLQREAPRRDPRLRIEHCTLINPSLVKRIKALGAIPVPFAGYVYFHGEKLHYYGDQRLTHMFAMRDFLDAGIKVPSSSDYTASPTEPMLWLRSQVTRADSKGHVWGGNQRITVEEAIRCGTLHGAYASFEENLKGSLEPGKLADLVVWDRDMLKTDPTEFLSIKPERTMTGGRWVYES